MTWWVNPHFSPQIKIYCIFGMKFEFESNSNSNLYISGINRKILFLTPVWASEQRPTMGLNWLGRQISAPLGRPLHLPPIISTGHTATAHAYPCYTLGLGSGATVRPTTNKKGRFLPSPFTAAHTSLRETGGESAAGRHASTAV